MIRTYLKAKCQKTGKFFALEITKYDGKPAVVTNFYEIDEEQANHLDPEYRVDENISVGSNLNPCIHCKTRRIAHCSHHRLSKTCRFNDKYDYQCLFCDQLKIDYTRVNNKDNSFYNKVNVSNLPASAFDKHGNPQGDQFDLAKDGSMKGFKIVILDFGGEGTTRQKLISKLKIKGFDVSYYGTNRTPTPLELKKEIMKGKTQLWIISGCKMEAIFRKKYLPVVIEYFNYGGGLYIWGDNEPLYAEANVVLKELFDANMYGNVPGNKIISIKKAGSISGIIPDHPIATGIINFHEGQSIATINWSKQGKNGQMRPLVYGSDGTVIASFYENKKTRLIADGGFTRLSSSNINKAGTERFVLNSAIWLAYVEKYGYSGDSLPLLK